RAARERPEENRADPLRVQRVTNGPLNELLGTGGERVAARRVAGLEAPPQPLLAVARGAVSEGLGLHGSLRYPLEPVVADRAGGPQAFLEVAGLDQLSLAVGVVSPHSRVAVRLQLDADRGRVAAPRAADLVEEAELVLDVVADLVGEDVGIRE